MLRTVVVILMLTGVVFAEVPTTMMEDFEGATVGQVPQGWKVAKTGTGEGSVWKVVEDKTSPRGAKVLAQIAESPGPMFNLCVDEKSNFQDVEVSVAFKAVAGKKDQGGGIVWRYKDENNYYVARFNPLEDNYRLYHIVNGKRTQIGGNESLTDKDGVWHTLSIKMVGDKITCTFNGKVEIEARDKTFTQAGKVGLWTKADAQTYFDDFTAKAITR